ncbi:MAG: ABC transporter ATP-binding protein [Hyphomicrobiaceae bacterium]
MTSTSLPKSVLTPPSNSTPTPAVEVYGLAKHYGPVKALRGVDLSIAAGEYFVLLGPSGGGKTTLLRTIGGFNRPTSGRVLLHGRDVTQLPPEKRPTSMVFQSYALFPHMTVAGNVGYGLSLTKRPRDEIKDKTSAMLEMVGLKGYDNRKPHELSGGQQQRVQLARSLVLDRDILLLDEPLAALDAKLRKDMCLELKHLQEQVGITFVHVTHNQEEAMTVADRIALIADGSLVEEGRAQDIYEAPQRRFTADFVGENNVIDAYVVAVEDKRVQLKVDGDSFFAERRHADVTTGQAVAVSLRSELLRLKKDETGFSSSDVRLSAVYRERVYLGLTTTHIVELSNGKELVVRAISGGRDDIRSISTGQSVCVGWQRSAARIHTK